MRPSGQKSPYSAFVRRARIILNEARRPSAARKAGNCARRRHRHQPGRAGAMSTVIFAGNIGPRSSNDKNLPKLAFDAEISFGARKKTVSARETGSRAPSKRAEYGLKAYGIDQCRVTPITAATRCQRAISASAIIIETEVMEKVMAVLAGAVRRLSRGMQS